MPISVLAYDLSSDKVGNFERLLNFAQLVSKLSVGSESHSPMIYECSTPGDAFLMTECKMTVEDVAGVIAECYSYPCRSSELLSY